MTAFEQAWSLLKSTIDRTFQSRLPIDNLMTHNTPDRTPIIDGKYKLPLQHQSLAPIIPLEQRLPKKPIPSHIEINPNFPRFELIGTEGQLLSTIQPGTIIPNPNAKFPNPNMPNTNIGLVDIHGETPANFRRQDYYNKLFRGLLNAGIDIKSDKRNELSHGFHTKLMDTMSPNINVIKPRGDLFYTSPIHYRRKDRPNVTMEELKQMQEKMPSLMSNDPNLMEIAASGLNRFDYGSLPIRRKEINPNYYNPTSSQTSLDEYSPSNFRGIDAIKERHRIQSLFDWDDY